MNPDSASNMLLDTDYPPDKVLDTFKGTFSAGARYGAFQPRLTNQPIPHSAGDYCLIIGSYSLNNSTWFPFGVVDVDTVGALPAFQTVEVNAYCTTTEVVIQASNFKTTSQTIYYALQIVSRD